MTDLSIGIVGVSPGNGHPYSFASIINGYDDEGFEQSNWGVIHDYLREKDSAEFGFPGVRVTHAWTQDSKETATLCEAACIPNQTDEFAELCEMVDAVIIARDDPDSHIRTALPALEAGLPVFVDKPLTVNYSELDTFRPYLQSGQLMSCSGLRYARELDTFRGNPDTGEVQLVTGVTVKDWERYSPHLLDPLLQVTDVRPVAVRHVPSPHESVIVELSNGASARFDAIGDGPFALDLSVCTDQAITDVAFRDNFVAFRRTLYHFIEQIRTGTPAIPPETTTDVVKTVIAGIRAIKRGTRVPVQE